jgi:hypothetical protein
MTQDMGSINVFHMNQWHDYTGGSDHSIDEIDACDADQDADGEERHVHIVILSADEYLELTSHAEESDPLPDPEDVVIGAIRRFGSVNEPLLRARWRGQPADAPLEKRVLDLLCSNGPTYHHVMAELRRAGHVA